ncbi:MAG: hypothetical protein JSR48_15350 [Verrucomicrobia bacterium]|nr:hypothetical protein [Verrucomicrobiota bacterium]
MNNDESKFLLGAYRSNGRDADDPLLATALAQARTDPAVGEWFQRSQAYDAAIAARLRDVAPPAGLREAILAGGRASRGARGRWRNPAPWLALAASVAVLLTAAVALWPRPAAAAATRLADFAIEDTVHGNHGSHGVAAGALQASLSDSNHRLQSGVPMDFAALRSTGCRTLSFAGHDVLEVCFQRDGQWFHCYIVRRADFPKLPADLRFVEHARLASAAWADASHYFVVVSEGGLEAVKRIL